VALIVAQAASSGNPSVTVRLLVVASTSATKVSVLEMNMKESNAVNILGKCNGLAL
jgi:hypothetical protein